MRLLELRLFPAVALVLLAAGCSATDLLYGTGRDAPSLIIFYGDTSRLIAPDTVTHGAPFSVSFLTFGDGCNAVVARTDVAVDGIVVQISPYDHANYNSPCGDVLRILPHTAQIRIDAPGVATIQVVGQQRGPVTGGTNVPATLTRGIVVR